MFSPALKTEFEAKLKEAIESGSFFITISYADPSGNKQLHHYYIRNEFPSNDILPSLKHLTNEIHNKEQI